MESIEKLRKMLERFYQGETTLEEERWLREHLLVHHRSGGIVGRPGVVQGF